MRSLGYWLAIVGCIVGSAFGYVFREVALRITGGETPRAVQEMEEVAWALFREISPVIWICGYGGIVMLFVGCFLIVRDKQLHPDWTFACFLSFLGVLVLAKLPEGNRPRSVREALQELWTLMVRLHTLFLVAFIISALVALAWVVLIPSPAFGGAGR